jgi:hypothetical protein
MRDLRTLDKYRDREGARRVYGWEGDETCGAFRIQSPVDRAMLVVVASAGEGWDHVSVSRPNRPPNWAEMSRVYRLFFKDDEEAMELHVPAREHINCHPNTLHLWRPHGARIPRPPGWMVGPMEKTG